MSSLNIRPLLLAALLLASGLAAAEDDAAMMEADHYLSGGIGLDARQAMHARRAHYNLRLAFADRHNGEYLAGLSVHITPLGKQGEPLSCEDCGPLLYAQLPPGRYKITADYEGSTRELSTSVGAKGVDRVMYWR